MSFLDIVPTILELAGVEEPLFEDGNRYLDGHSLVPLLEDEKATWYRPVISSYRNSPDTTQERFLLCAIFCQNTHITIISDTKAMELMVLQ